MVPHSAALDALLATRNFFRFELYSFAGGNLGSNVLRYCAGDRDLTLNGYLYSSGGAGGPYFDRKDNKAKVRQQTGLQVAQLVFDVMPGTAQIFGVPFGQAARTGVFDGAELTLERVFTPLSNWADTSRGGFRRFVGRVAEIDFGRSVLTFTVNSHAELLNQMLPRNLYQPGCVNSLYDAACGVNPALYQQICTVSTAVSNKELQTTSMAAPSTPGAWTAGKITFTSGNNSGLSRTIQSFSYSGGVTDLVMLAPFPGPAAPGDGFIANLGCDKSRGPDGCPKFSNTDRYKGFPEIPQPTTAV